MNKETWHGIFNNVIDCNDAITVLAENDVISEDEALKLKAKCLDGLVESFKSEVKK